MSNQEKVSSVLKMWHEELGPDCKGFQKIRNTSDLNQFKNVVEILPIVSKLEQLGLSNKGAFCLVGLVANVNTDDPTVEFVCSLGRVRNRNQKPAYCEIHFERLCASQRIEMFYRRLKRVILVLQRKIDITSLVECVTSWEHHHENGLVQGKFSGEYLERLRASYYEEINK